MRILVTGGSGFIGSNLVRLLVQEKGCSVVNVDKLSYAANPDSLVDLSDDPNYAFEQIDLCDAAALKTVFEKHRPDYVMHLAAESHVDRSIEGPNAFIQTNVVGTYNLLQASLEHWRSLPAQESFRFLHVSTDEVYGSLGPNDPPFSERSPLAPSSPYSASKAAADHLVQSWKMTYGLPTILTRCGNNFGPYQYPEKLIPKVIQCCLNAESIPLYGSGQNVRDWISVKDHCEALWCILQRGQVGQIYNVGANNERRNIDLVRMVCRVLEEHRSSEQIEKNLTSGSSLLSRDKAYETLISFVTDRPGHDFRYAIDSTKLRTELGWEAQEDFECGVRKTVKWYSALSTSRDTIPAADMR